MKHALVAASRSTSCSACRRRLRRPPEFESGVAPRSPRAGRSRRARRRPWTGRSSAARTASASRPCAAAARARRLARRRRTRAAVSSRPREGRGGAALEAGAAKMASSRAAHAAGHTSARSASPPRAVHPATPPPCARGPRRPGLHLPARTWNGGAALLSGAGACAGSPPCFLGPRAATSMVSARRRENGSRVCGHELGTTCLAEPGRRIRSCDSQTDLYWLVSYSTLGASFNSR